MKRLLQRAVLITLLCGACQVRGQRTDLSASYTWKPVRIGAGGFVVGLVLHPLDPAVRYVRTDVGNAYRWDAVAQIWVAMRTLHSDGSGIHSPGDTSAPSTYGIDSIAVDPRNPAVVYMVFPALHSNDVKCGNSYVQIYKSVDGGQNFVPGGLAAAEITGNPNGDHRQYGERLVVDPANSKVLYYGSDKQGLLRSVDGGVTWTSYRAASGLPEDVEFINIQFDPAAGSLGTGAALVTRTVFAVSVQNNSDAGGDVYESDDGGKSWRDISTDVVDAGTNTKFSHQAGASSIDRSGILYVAENFSTNGNHRAFWKLAAGTWSRISLESGKTKMLEQPVTSVVADPFLPNRLYTLGLNSSMSRSDDGGRHWLSLGPALYANRFGWLPQTVGMVHGEWHSNGGLHLDRDGNLWVPTGQEGVLTMKGADAANGSAIMPPRWTITSRGIEEQVSQDVILPRGSGDTILVATEDTTGFVIHNPDDFSALQIPLQNEIISQGTSIETAPDVPSYIAITASNVYTNGPNYSGYSADGGATWKPFGKALQYECSAKKMCDVPAGIIAVGARATRTLGRDHIVLLPPLNFAPQYSHDGGMTWHVSQSFPLQTDGMRLNTSGGIFSGFTIPELHQHLLRADPFVEDKFYLKLTHAPASLYVSTDGGVTWTAEPNANLPDSAFHGQLVTNNFVKDDLWFADGWEGSFEKGVFHSSDGGKTFAKISGFTHVIDIAVGKGSGLPDDATYAIYVYAQRSDDPAYGVFQSVNEGKTWQRIARYPLGIYDRPITLAASQDTFGKVVLGWNGNSFAYSRYTPIARY